MKERLKRNIMRFSYLVLVVVSAGCSVALNRGEAPISFNASTADSELESNGYAFSFQVQTLCPVSSGGNKHKSSRPLSPTCAPQQETHKNYRLREIKCIEPDGNSIFVFNSTNSGTNLIEQIQGSYPIEFMQISNVPFEPLSLGELTASMMVVSNVASCVARSWTLDFHWNSIGENTRTGQVRLQSEMMSLSENSCQSAVAENEIQRIFGNGQQLEVQLLKNETGPWNLTVTGTEAQGADFCSHYLGHSGSIQAVFDSTNQQVMVENSTTLELTPVAIDDEMIVE